MHTSHDPGEPRDDISARDTDEGVYMKGGGGGGGNWGTNQLQGGGGGALVREDSFLQFIYFFIMQRVLAISRL